MNIADRIQSLRKSKGISQEQLADAVGVSRQAVSKWESEQSIPDLEKVIIMSNYFGVTTDYILKGIEPIELDETKKGIEPIGLNRAKTGFKISNRVKAGVCTALGLAVNLVVYIMSRFVEVPIPYNYIENGQKMYGLSGDRVGHSYRYFVAHYDLEFLMVLSWIMVVVGLVWLLLSTRRVRE